MKPEGHRREGLVDELLEKERSIAKEKEKLKAETKSRRGKIEALEERRDELLDLLDGREHEESELPLTTPKGGKKPVPPPLDWKREGANQVARVRGFGTYCVELGTGGKYDILFTPPGGVSKSIGSATVEAEAKDVAKKHYLVEGADRILENAGDGKLTRRGRAALKSVDRA